jgi:hypothetical protein
MSEAYPSRCVVGAIEFESGHAAGLRAADWLGLAAAPTFAIMALLTGVLGSGQTDVLCAAAEHTSPLSGMIPMYLLMSAFHVPPWLKLIASRRNGARSAQSGGVRTSLGAGLHPSQRRSAHRFERPAT